MKRYLLFLLMIASCKATDYKMIKKVGEDLGGGGTIGIYRTDVNFSKIHNYKKYFEVVLNGQDLFRITDSATVYKVAAYRLYKQLSNADKKRYEAIRVVIKDNLLSQLDTTNFFRMDRLEKTNKSESVVRGYLNAIENSDTAYIYKAFDQLLLNYSKNEIDSINRCLSLKTKNKFQKSKLFNWAVVQDGDSKYRLLVFLADTSNTYNVRFQFVLHDSIKENKNIVSIKY